MTMEFSDFQTDGGDRYQNDNTFNHKGLLKSTSVLSKSYFVVQVSFRGDKVSIGCDDTTTTHQLKCSIAQQQKSSEKSVLLPVDLKLMYKGKVMQDDQQLVLQFLDSTRTNNKSSTTVATRPQEYKIIATGMSKTQQHQIDQEIQDGINGSKFRVKDDLSDFGQLAIRKRNQEGYKNLSKSSNKILAHSNQKYGFGKIEVLQGFPNESTARNLLEKLAKDPGIIGCMTKHRWYVPVLAELYPEGQVGQSAECVMGYNTNRGQLIKLRLRTDDLQGFRKLLSIRQVLYHELAHNVYPDHDTNFFQMMRQIEHECNEFDWTKGAGLSTNGGNDEQRHRYEGGSYRLGQGQNNNIKSKIPPGANTLNGQVMRDRAALAAERRLRRTSGDQRDIAMECGCGTSSSAHKDVFLPNSFESVDTITLQLSRKKHDTEMSDKNENHRIQ